MRSEAKVLAAVESWLPALTLRSRSLELPTKALSELTGWTGLFSVFAVRFGFSSPERGSLS